MTFDLSFWRFVIFLNITKSGLWKKCGTTCWLNVGTFTNGKDTGFQVIVLPFSLQIGFVCKVKS